MEKCSISAERSLVSFEYDLQSIFGKFDYDLSSILYLTHAKNKLLDKIW